MKKQFGMFLLLISCFVSSLFLIPYCSWGEQCGAHDECDVVSDVQSDYQEQSVAPTADSINAAGISDGSDAAIPDVSYKTHISGIGWERSYAKNGSVSGTTGRSRRIEALRVSLANSDGLGIQYRAHVQNIGWQDWVADGAVSGTTGKSLRVEAVELKLLQTRRHGIQHRQSVSRSA